MQLAPLTLFVYNRPWHTKQTIEALLKNGLSSSSQLFIFSDGPNGDHSVPEVQEVRKLLKTVKGFKNIQIIEREKNWGLAENIIEGVTSVVNQYGKVIVLEDDLVTSPYFLQFMNDALNFYQKEQRVWHISGWNYPVSTKGLPDTFLWRVMNCWGWATWVDRWQYYEKSPEKLLKTFSSEDINRFNLDGFHNFWEQVEANMEGRLKTWAIFWYATIFNNRGLCCHPSLSLVENIGHDGSGSNCAKTPFFHNALSDSCPRLINHDVVENELALARIKSFYKRTSSIWVRLLYKFKGLTCKVPVK
jgi:hypothetical protein